MIYLMGAIARDNRELRNLNQGRVCFEREGQCMDIWTGR